MKVLSKFVIGLLLLGIILWRLDVRSIFHAIGSYRVEYVVVSAVLFLLSSIIGVLRWRLFLPQYAFTRLLRLSFIGQLYAVLLPGQVAGEAVKAYRIARGQADKTRLVGSVLIDRIIGTIALLCLGGVGVWLSSRGTIAKLGLSFIILILVLCASFNMMRIKGLYELTTRAAIRLQRRSARCAPIGSAILLFLGVWRGYAMDPFRLLASFILGLVFQCVGVVIYAVLAHGLGIDVALTDWLWINGIVALAMILPVSVAGIGLREGALIGSLGFLGVQGERAIALSFGLFALMLFGALIGWIVEISDRGSASR